MIKKTFLLALILSIFVFVSLPDGVEAAEFVTGPEVLIGPDEVVNEDVYAFGGLISVEGTINGDLVAAGGSIDISGTVNGDVIVAGESITISGSVKDDIRAAGNNILILSSVGGDVIAGGNQIIIEAESIIGDDLVVGADTLVMRGVVKGDLDIGVKDVRISGTVMGDVDANVEDRFRLGPNSRIEGALTYTSPNDVTFQPGAEVMGDVTKNIPKSSVLGVEVQDSSLIRALNEIVSRMQWFLGTVFVGLILLFIFPETMRGVIGIPIASPWRSLGAGSLVLIVTPIAALILGGIAIFIGGFAAVPIAVVPAAIYLGLLLLSTPLIAMLIGGFIFTRFAKRDDYAPWVALLIGAAVLAIIGFVPFVDVIVGILTILFGFGAWLLFLLRNYREARITERV